MALRGMVALLVVAAVAAAGCGRPEPPPEARAGEAAPATVPCSPTYPDELSPSYRPDAPVRSVVGHGHVLAGTVLSSRDCAPVAGARVELWPEGPEGGHPDAARATVLAGPDGSYRFECDPTDHVHMRVSAPGFQVLATNRYHTEGRPAGTFEVVLAPEG